MFLFSALLEEGKTKRTSVIHSHFSKKLLDIYMVSFKLDISNSVTMFLVTRIIKQNDSIESTSEYLLIIIDPLRILALKDVVS